MVLFLVTFWVVMVAGIAALRLTEEVKVFGLVIIPTALVAGLLVVYFNWRGKLRSRIGDELHEYRKAA